MKLGDYECQTTFWIDFSIAEKFGVDAVQDTYNRAFNEWKDSCVYLTELVMVLNWKMWHHNKKNERLSILYEKLYLKTNDYAWSHLKGEEQDYFFKVTG